MEKKKEIVMSGIRPTGFFAPIRNKVDSILQDEEGLKQIMQRALKRQMKVLQKL
jgi:hypothetical protein